MTTRPFPIDTKRTAIAIAYRNEGLIADKVLPYEPVGGEKFSYTKHNLADGFTIPDTKVGRKSNPNAVSFSAKEETEKVEAYGLEDFVPQSDIDNAPENYDPLNRSVTGIMDLITLDREVRVANLVFNANTYATNKKVLANAERFDTSSTGADPVDVIQDAIKAMIIKPNQMVLGAELWMYLRKHESITKAIFGDANKGKLIRREELAELFELKEVLVGESFVNIAKKGKAVELQRCWGKKIGLFNQNPASANYGTFGFTARHGNRIASSKEIEKKGLTGGTEVWAGEFVKEIICSEPHGYLIDNCIS